MPEIREAVIVASKRSAVGKSGRGTLRNTRPDDMGSEVLKATMASIEGFDPAMVEDIAIGCAMPEAEQGLNVGRVIGIGAGCPDETPALTVNRFCSSGLQTIAGIANRIQVGAIDCGVGGGIESMSMVPMGGNKPRVSPKMIAERPEVYVSMGVTAENVARKYGVSREDQDAFALESHRRAIAAIEGGRFKDEIIPVTTLEGKLFDTDEGPRADTSPAALARLRPVFHVKGTVTAGNSSQTSDGVAMTVVMSADKAKEIGAKPLARFVGFAVAGVAPEIMGIGPVAAIPKVLKQTGLKLEDIDLFELNEAFAAQSLAVVRELGLDQDKVNVNGGAIALGHPLGCTGAKLTATLLSELRRRQGRYGMVTMCIGGGMGAAGIFEAIY
ncbi:acetyl-CoA acyltransferase [Plesiocystis pacifica SIR-1]|uniref:acetyl-CoA C-acyltransferase n=1 Tax=Plesiocystis pacifica SIR-1 TaxID=391625 RepID=A6GBG2_9BACT|nr:acetyl-CoA C-acyltransferase [Plesiocystis pacifica]EDM76766.1 acetyl-CoA acyltransferase [Plesiocystis pacifica SIR-1]